MRAPPRRPHPRRARRRQPRSARRRPPAPAASPVAPSRLDRQERRQRGRPPQGLRALRPGGRGPGRRLRPRRAGARPPAAALRAHARPPNKEALAELERRRAAETDALVRQDLDILIQSARDQIEGDALERKYELTYFDVPLTIFRGLRSLLDDQIAPERRPAALVRLKKYAGDVPGTTPLTVLAEQRMRERLGDASLARARRGRRSRRTSATRRSISTGSRSSSRSTRSRATRRRWPSSRPRSPPTTSS